MVNLTARVSKGILSNVVQDLADKAKDFAVMDVGAGQETQVRDLLPWLADEMRQLGGLVVVLRPLTTGSHNLRNSCSFVAENAIPTVFLRNLGQNRHEEWRWDRWRNSEARKKAHARGAIETTVPDADVSYVDESLGFGISLAEIALRDFSRVKEEDAEDARIIFNDDVCAWLNVWLRESMGNIGAAIQDAIAERERLDAAPAEAAQAAAAAVTDVQQVKEIPRRGRR